MRGRGPQEEAKGDAAGGGGEESVRLEAGMFPKAAKKEAEKLGGSKFVLGIPGTGRPVNDEGAGNS